MTQPLAMLMHLYKTPSASLSAAATPPPPSLNGCRYPADAWEMLLGYDQDRFMGARAGAALVSHIQVAAALKAESETPAASSP